MIDYAAILALNQAHEKETSALDQAGLRALTDQSFHLGLRAEGRDGFLIALDQDAIYASANLAWFKARYPRFIYIDRVIVAPHARGSGLARALYEDLFRTAAASAHDMIGCEVYKTPPNPASDAFHARLGFTIIGEASSADGEKTVRYMTRKIS